MKFKIVSFISELNRRRVARFCFPIATFLFAFQAAVSAQSSCSMFPADNIWNTPVDTLPVDSHSSAYINSIGATRTLHADFGSGTWDGGPIGIPFVTVSGAQARVNVTFDYWDESDSGPYPIPSNPPIEGGANSDGDRHILIVDTDHCILYELYHAFRQNNGSWTAGSGAIYDLTSNELRPAGWTSADAAGMPILPGLVRYDEVASGEIRHAIRFTAPQTRQTYIWPARHAASSLTGLQYPPMGQRFRLKAGYDITGFSPETRVILQAMKTYGLILADNGSAWYISGAPDERWNNDVLHELGSVAGSAFEAVDISSLMVSADSGQVNTVAPPPPPPPVPDPGPPPGADPGPAPITGTTDDSSTAITYDGNWARKKHIDASNGTFRQTARKNASVSFSVTGTQFTWITCRGPKFGLARVMVDGGEVATVDLYNAVKECPYEVPVTGLADGDHSVEIVVLGLRGEGSRGKAVVFDGVSVP